MDAGNFFNAPQQGARTRRQLARTERLGHVIIGAKFQAQHPIHFARPRAQDDDRNKFVAPTNFAQHVKAVLVRQAQI